MSDFEQVLTDKEREVLETATPPTLTLRGSSRARIQLGVSGTVIAVGLGLSLATGNGAFLNFAGAIVISVGVLFGLSDLTMPKTVDEIPEDIRRAAIARIEGLSLSDQSQSVAVSEMDKTTLNFFEKNPRKWPAIVEYQQRQAFKFFARCDAYTIIAGTIATGLSAFL